MRLASIGQLLEGTSAIPRLSENHSAGFTSALGIKVAGLETNTKQEPPSIVAIVSTSIRSSLPQNFFIDQTICVDSNLVQGDIDSVWL